MATFTNNMSNLENEDEGEYSSETGNTIVSRRWVQSKYWVMTFNNYDEKDLERLLEICNSCPKIKNYIIGKEIGEENGTPHLQCFFECNKAERIPELLRIKKKPHYEHKARRATVFDNIVYCCKENDFYSNYPIEILEKAISMAKEKFGKKKNSITKFIPADFRKEIQQNRFEKEMIDWMYKNWENKEDISYLECKALAYEEESRRLINERNKK